MAIISLSSSICMSLGIALPFVVMVQSNDEDSALVEAVLGGDPDAYRGLVERYQNRIYNVIYGMVHNREDAMELATKIRQKRAMVVNTHRIDAKNRNRSVVPKKFRLRTAADLKAHLDSLGVPSEDAVDTVSRGRKRGRSKSRHSNMDIDDEDDSVSKRTRSRSRSVKPPQAVGLKNERARKKVKKMIAQSQKKRNQLQRKGPGDRTILNLMPKHLYSGKRGIGSTDRR